MTIISVESLSFTYQGSPAPALDGVSFSVEEGEYVAIVGANGSGKSTLVRCLDGLLVPPRGSVLVGGHDPSLPAARRELRSILSLVFQSPPDQIVASTVEEDVAFGLENLGLPRNEMLPRVDLALAATGLSAERSRSPRFLSAGQQQRLAVAGAVAMRPRCVLFDEATSMIDPNGRAGILDLMDGLVRAGTTVIHVTHDMAEAARAGRAIVLSRGRLAFDGTPAELFASDGLAELSLALPESALAARAAGLETRPGEDASGFGLRLARQSRGPGRAFPPLTALAGSFLDGPAPSDPSPAPPSGAARAASAFLLKAASLTYLAGGPNERLALDAVDLDVPAGAVLALVGATGSGKSSLLQLMASLSFPKPGTVLHFGTDTDAAGADPRVMRVRSPLSVQRPETAIFEQYAGDEAAFGPRNQGLKAVALVARVRDAMDRVGLPYAGFRDRRARSLSGGEKRRLALASVLAMDPDALLLDEPSSALDPASKRAVMDTLFLWARDPARPRTLVFATHSMEEAARADLVAVVGSGKVLATGAPSLVFGEGWDPAWGVGRPFAAEALDTARRAGLDAPAGIASLDELLALLGMPHPAVAAPGGGA